MQKQEYILLSKAAKLSPGRPHTSAIWRWCRKGLKSRSGENIRLRHIRVGGKIYTTVEWLQDFFTTVAESDTKYFDSQKTHTCNRKKIKPNKTQREREVHLAEIELEKYGI